MDNAREMFTRHIYFCRDILLNLDNPYDIRFECFTEIVDSAEEFGRNEKIEEYQTTIQNLQEQIQEVKNNEFQRGYKEGEENFSRSFSAEKYDMNRELARLRRLFDLAKHGVRFNTYYHEGQNVVIPESVMAQAQEMMIKYKEWAETKPNSQEFCNHKIKAIKLIREYSDMGLLSSKNFVERADLFQQPIKPSETQNG